MDGIDILKSIKTRPSRRHPIVIISGHGNIKYGAKRAIKQGAYDFIEKPFSIDQLLVVIRLPDETSAVAP
jgi:two-component system nitrogen regulation response regulator NtrX